MRIAPLTMAALDVLRALAARVSVNADDVLPATLEELKSADCLLVNGCALEMSAIGKDRLSAAMHEGWRHFLESKRSITFAAAKADDG